MNVSKKKQSTNYTPGTYMDKKLSLPWVISLVVGSIITSAVGTAFALIGIANNDHFIVSATAIKVDKLENNYVSRSELLLYLEPIKQSLVNLETNYKSLDSKLDKVLK